MSYFYDVSTKGFFLEGFHGEIPHTAIKLTDQQYKEFVDGQAQGKQIIEDKTGGLILIDPQPSAAHDLNRDTLTWEISAEKLTALLADTQARLIANIDEHAAKIYSAWTRFESEYRERQAAAEAFKSANYEGECSRYISDFAQRAHLDNKTSTNLILTQAAGLEKLQVELANQRMRKYELKVPGLTIEKMQSIHDDIIKQMDALMEAYNNG